MMKQIRFFSIVALSAMVLAAGVYQNGLAAFNQDVQQPQLAGAPYVANLADPSGLDIVEGGVVTAALSPAEAEGLVFMREEEKLARDVYLAMYDLWGMPVFQNISQSEQAHMEAIKGLLDTYGLDDPATSQPGVFTNPELQALYTTLVAQGGQSVAEALKVGAAIEEIDILDLQKRIAETDQFDIQQVYSNLEAGSENHLRAFVSNLQNRTGEVYQPQYLPQDAYDAIIAGGMSGGGRGQGGFGGGRGGGQGGRGRGAGG